MSETFVNIDSLQHYEPAKNPRFNIHFQINANHTNLSMTSTFQCEYCQCFTFKRCDKIQTEMY